MQPTINPFNSLQNLALGSTQLANAAGITSRQLRYWEMQGYITALPEKANNARQYSIGTALTVIAIKQGLNNGLKLADAVISAQGIIDQSNYLGRLITDTYQGYTRDGQEIALNFGSLNAQPDQQVTGVLTPDSTYFTTTKRSL